MKAVTLKKLEKEIYNNNTVSELKERQKIDSFGTLCSSILSDEVVILAGRPGLGKTTFLYNMLVNRIAQNNDKVLLLSTNDNSKSIHSNLKKIIDGLENKASVNLENILINPQKIHKPFIAQEFIENTIKEYDVKAIYIDDISVLSYLSEMYYYEDADESFSDYSEDSPWFRGINLFLQFVKSIGTKYNIPVVLTEDVTRKIEERYALYKMPRISDMRSEKLETLADKIYLLYRQAYYGITEDEDGNDTKGVMDIFVGKNKSGETEKHIQLWLNPDSLYE